MKVVRKCFYVGLFFLFSIACFTFADVVEKPAFTYEFIKCGPIPARKGATACIWGGIGQDAKGRVAVAIGNHVDDVFFYIWEPGMKEGKLIARFQDVVKEGKREYGSGKVHHHLFLGSKGKMWFATMLGYYYGYPRRFPGAHFLSLDTESNELKDYGIPYPNDSIIGADLDEKSGKFYGVTMYDGNLIECDINTGESRNLGHTGGGGTRGIFIDAWHRVYFPDKNGTMRRYDPEKEKMEDLPFGIPKAGREWQSVVGSADRKQFYIVGGWEKELLFRYRADKGMGSLDDLSAAIKGTSVCSSNLGISKSGKLYMVNTKGRLIQIDPDKVASKDLGQILPPGSSKCYGIVTGQDWIADDTFYAGWHENVKGGTAAILIIHTPE